MDHPKFFVWCIFTQAPKPGDTSSTIASEVDCRTCIRDMDPKHRTPKQRRIIKDGMRGQK